MPFEMNCINCGHTLKITEWGPGRICPICEKNTANVNIKEVHVFFGDSHSQCFHHSIYHECMNDILGRTGERYVRYVDYHYLRLDLEMCFGSISNPPYSNANYYAHHGSTATNAKTYIENQLAKLDDVDSATPIYLWLNDNAANELVNLLYFSKNFDRFENIFLVKWIHTEKNFDDSRLTMIEAIKNKTKLSKQDINDMYERFSEIQNLNADCLLGNSDYVEPWSLDKIENLVLQHITNRYRSFGNIFSNVVDDVEKKTSFYISYNMVIEIVHRLMMTGKIESQGPCMWWGDTCCNNTINFQKFRLTNPKAQKYSYEDSIRAVCDAFEFGYTYPLYDLLDDNSVLSIGDKTASGKWGIIEHIENDGNYRVHCLKEKVECHIMRVENGGKYYQKDDVCIFLSYDSDKKYEHWLIKVIFDGAVIRSIEMSKPRDLSTLVAVEE